MKKKILLSSIVTIALCLCMIAGSTYALFTSGSEFNIAVSAGTVDIKATILEGSLQTKSLEQAAFDNDVNFTNGGYADLDAANGTLTLALLTPGDEVKFDVQVENNSNVNIKYRVRLESSVMTVTNADGSNTDLNDILPALTGTVTVNGTAYTLADFETSDIPVGANEAITNLSVHIAFPDAADNNDYKNAGANIHVVIEAVQGNGDF